MTQDTSILFFHGVSDLLRKLVHRHGDVILSIKNYLGTKGCYRKLQYIEQSLLLYR